MAFKLGELFAEVDGVAELYQRIKVLLLTDRGSLPGDPKYGTAIAQYIPYSDQNRPQVMAEILDAVGRYEPDIRISEIDVRLNTVTVTAEGVGAIVV